MTRGARDCDQLAADPALEQDRHCQGQRVACLGHALASWGRTDPAPGRAAGLAAAARPATRSAFCWLTRASSALRSLARFSISLARASLVAERSLWSASVWRKVSHSRRATCLGRACRQQRRLGDFQLCGDLVGQFCGFCLVGFELQASDFECLSLAGQAGVGQRQRSRPDFGAERSGHHCRRHAVHHEERGPHGVRDKPLRGPATDAEDTSRRVTLCGPHPADVGIDAR